VLTQNYIGASILYFFAHHDIVCDTTVLFGDNGRALTSENLTASIIPLNSWGGFERGSIKVMTELNRPHGVEDDLIKVGVYVAKLQQLRVRGIMFSSSLVR
jgi:hypothetical protein